MLRRGALLASVLALTALVAYAAPRRRVLAPRNPDSIAASLIAAPQPVIVDGVPHLAWEVVLNNLRSEDFTITAVDVVTDGAVVTYSGEALRTRTTTIGQITIIYFIVAREQPPSYITHTIRLATPRGAETLYGPFTFVRNDPPVVLSAPLRGSSWRAANGLHDDSFHRRAAFLIEGRLTIPQRYAIDWVQLDERGSTYSGDVNRNTSFYAYGRELLAVTDATVTATKDGIAENVPRRTPVVPITLDTAAGNYVILDLGQGRYALYAHLQPGSLRVKTGDRVTRGTVLGLLGNSGNSTEPHLHFHVCDANAALACDGLPYVFDHFSTTEGRKQLELPKSDAIVDFDH